MKKLIVLFLTMFAVVMIIPSVVSADMPPGPGFHSIDFCAMIVNQNEFPDIVLVAYTSGPMSSKSVGALIENGRCLNGGYKFTTLSIYWVTKDKLKLIDLKNLKIKTEKIPEAYDEKGVPLSFHDSYSPIDLNLLVSNIRFYGGYIEDATHISKQNIEYSIGQTTNGKFVLYKSRQITEYNNGDSKKVEVFSNPTNNIGNTQNPVSNDKQSQKSIPIKRGFWQSVGCFFKGLFGGSC